VGLGGGEAAMATGQGPDPTVEAMTCPSSTLCFGADNRGRIIRSLDPADPQPHWVAQQLPNSHVFVNVACASPSLCIAVDILGRTLGTWEPTAPVPRWNLESPAMLLVNSMTCSSLQLCVMVDGEGDAAISTDPNSVLPSWSTSKIDPAVEPAKFGDPGVASISCPSVELCIAVDEHGRAVRTTDPTSPRPTWSAPEAIDDERLSGVSCPSASMCVAVDDAGRAIVSHDPAAKSPVWVTHTLRHNAGLVAVSCPSFELCVVSGHRIPPETGGFVMASTDPGAAEPTWTTTDNSIYAGELSCPSSSFCLLFSNGNYQLASRGNALISQDPGAASPTWTESHVTDQLPASLPAVPAQPTVTEVTVSFPFTCTYRGSDEPWWNGTGHECAGSATLTAVEQLARNRHTVTGVGPKPHSRRHRVVVLGQTGFRTWGNGFAQTYSIRLDALGQHLLNRFKRLPATLAVNATAEGQEDLSILAPLGNFAVTFALPRSTHQAKPKHMHHRRHR
jgi:hypothetical protein